MAVVAAPHIDQWRVYLQQCPDCGEVHGKSGQPDHHVSGPDGALVPIHGRAFIDGSLEDT